MHISLHIPPVPPVPLRVTAIKVHMPTQALYDPVEFKEVLTDIWWDEELIPQDYIRNLYHSMPNRLLKVIERGGKMTKY